MSAALVYLVRCSFINAVLVRLRRLRQPKYIVGARLGFSYFYFHFYRFVYAGAYQSRTERAVNSTVSPELAYNLAALALFMALILFAWIVPAERTAITLAESEVVWLLPAPITRTQFLHYKLLKAQLGASVPRAIDDFGYG